MPRHRSLEDLFWTHLDDLHHSERTIAESLARLSVAVSETDLREAFEGYVSEIETQAGFLEQMLEEGARRKESYPSQNGKPDWRARSRELWRGYFDPQLRDAGLVIAVRFLAEYKIAAYRAAREWAELLGYDELVAVLERCLEGEQMAVDRLSSLASGLLRVSPQA